MTSTSASPLRRRLTIALLVLLALLPVLFIFARTQDARRNIVYWDEIDTAVAMMLRLHDDASPGNFLRELWAINNEHRMVTSRLLFATSHALTGTVNFVFVNVVGNLTLVALSVLLIVAAGTTARRLRMAVVLAALLYQLQHYESFMWSGASIDHFQVVLLAAAAIVAVARNTRAGVIVGAVFATLATFTLAHGILTWAIGAAMLWHAGNRRGCALWCGIAIVAVGAFLLGFQLNRAQGFATLSGAGVLLVVGYWLTLLGAVPALGGNALAPWLGAALLGLIGWLAARGAARREPIAFAFAAFAIFALALIAVGRAEHSAGVVYSRYYVLGASAWAMAIFMLLERYSSPARPLALLGWTLPVLAVFNVAANRAFARHADSWLECRDRAAVHFLQHGVDGRGPLTLHPAPAHATALLQKAEQHGVYRMAPVCLERTFPRDAKPSTRLAYFVDAMTVSERSVFITGWAALTGERARRGQVQLVLRSDKETLLFTTVTETRPDVAKATEKPEWELSGFLFVARRERIPEGDYQVGFLIDGPDGPEFTLTAHRVQLIGEGKALLATGD